MTNAAEFIMGYSTRIEEFDCPKCGARWVREIGTEGSCLDCDPCEECGHEVNECVCDDMAAATRFGFSGFSEFGYEDDGNDGAVLLATGEGKP